MDDQILSLAGLLGTGVESMTDLGISHEWRLYRARVADGREVFVKYTAERTGVLAAEAAGLRWLAEPAVALVPEVLAADDRMLVLPWLPAEPPSDAAAERFGRELASLHASGAAAFGAPWRGFIARLPLDNTAGTDWPEWYADRRLAPFLDRAAPVLGGSGVALLERVIQRIDTLAGPAEPPSRIHGDLWSGNVRWAGDRAWLIDPAAHGGHRETDLAMLALFGAPRLSRVIAAYQEVSPLAEGWQARVPLHQLHPLLVHVVLFGGSYRAGALEAARAALASA